MGLHTTPRWCIIAYDSTTNQAGRPTMTKTKTAADMSIRERRELIERFAEGHARHFPTVDVDTAGGRVVIREQLALSFRETHSGYDQYDGYPEERFGDVVRVTTSVRTKFGQAFQPGDVSVVITENDPDSLIGTGLETSVCVYSWRNGIGTWIDRDKVEVVG